MCRFLVYSGEPILLYDLLFAPEHSLVKQSFAARDEEDRVNADGFGVGWYAPEASPAPAVFRSPQPAWSCSSLRSISGAIRSGLLFAHVRAGSPGMEVSEENCHPFTAGPFLWMHNGTLGGHEDFRDWARRFLSRASFSRIRGTTDSELLFALFLEQWDEARQPRDAQGLAGALRRTLDLVEDILRDSGVKEPSSLNLALTDGQSAIATRLGIRLAKPPPSLYLAKHVRLGRGPNGCRFEHPVGARAAIIASEALFPDPAWEEVPAGSLVVVDPLGAVEEVAL